MKKLIRRTLRGLCNRLPGTVHEWPMLEITPFDTPLDSIYSPRQVVFHVPVRFCMNLYFQSYAHGAQNPYVETIREYIAGTHTVYEGSRLYRYYEKCRLDILNDPYREFIESLALPCPRVLTSGSGNSRPPFPWEPSPQCRQPPKRIPASAAPVGQLLYPHEKARQNFIRLTGLYESIKQHGYRPTIAHGGEIQGFFLKRRLSDGVRDYRFIITGGMHRSAVLSALRNEQIRVTFREHSFRVIDLSDLEDWPQVKARFYEPQAARQFFLKYFVDLVTEMTAVTD